MTATEDDWSDFDCDDESDVQSNNNNLLLLTAGYIKREFGITPIELHEIIERFIDSVWGEKEIHFQKRKGTNSRIKYNDTYLPSMTTNTTISSKISNHWIVKYKITSKQTWGIVLNMDKYYNTLVDKYKPKTSKDLIGNPKCIQQLKDFLLNWDIIKNKSINGKQSVKKGVLLSGPP
eukprot:521078_1